MTETTHIVLFVLYFIVGFIFLCAIPVHKFGKLTLADVFLAFGLSAIWPLVLFAWIGVWYEEVVLWRKK